MDALFIQMKKTFGLGCHIITLHSDPIDSASVSTRIKDPNFWAQPIKERKLLEKNENTKTDQNTADYGQCLWESDFKSVSTFLKEFLCQSLLPTMERNVQHWNEQVYCFFFLCSCHLTFNPY